MCCTQVYFQANCCKTQLLCTLDPVSFPPEVCVLRALCSATLHRPARVLRHPPLRATLVKQAVAPRAELISRILDGLTLDDATGKPMLPSDIPVTWTAS